MTKSKDKENKSKSNDEPIKKVNDSKKVSPSIKKYIALTNIRHNGKAYSKGEEIEYIETLFKNGAIELEK